MKERVISSSAVLADCIADGARKLNIEANFDQCLSSIDPGVMDRINETLLQIVISEIPSEVLPKTSIESLMDETNEFMGIRMWSSQKNDHTSEITFYRVKPSWQATGLSLIGLGISLALMSPSAVVPVLNLVKTSWENLITLKRPEDDLAIDAYQGLIKAKLNNLEKLKREGYHPTLIEIHNASQIEKMDKTAFGLTQLKDLQLVQVNDWGDQKGDYSNPQNTWDLQF